MHADLFDLLDDADYRDRMRLRGGNFDWRDSVGTLGATYFHTTDDGNLFRDGIDVYDLHAKGTPFEAFPQVSLAAE